MDTARARAIAQHDGGRSASILGRVIVPANGKLGDIRIRIHGPGHASEFVCHGGTWARFGLPVGPYRIELVADRLVLAKRVDLRPGDELTVDFEVR